jgi:hypothetical protein
LCRVLGFRLFGGRQPPEGGAAIRSQSSWISGLRISRKGEDCRSLLISLLTTRTDLLVLAFFNLSRNNSCTTQGTIAAQLRECSVSPDKPGEGVLVHGVDVGHIGDAEEQDSDVQFREQFREQLVPNSGNVPSHLTNQTREYWYMGSMLAISATQKNKTAM